MPDEESVEVDEPISEPNPATKQPQDEEAPAAACVNEYPAEIYQDHVGHAASVGDNVDTEPLLATEHNVVSRNSRFGPEGFGIDPGGYDSEPDYADPEEGEEQEWTDVVLGPYFNIMGFLFKLNTLRLEQQQLPKAIAILVLLLLVVAFYIAHCILGGMMIYVGHKYRDAPCEENVANWLLVMGAYIVASAACLLLSAWMAITWKKDYLSIVRSFAAIFAFVWYIIGCVRVYKIDVSDHTCQETVFDFGYYYITISLILFSTACCCGCCGGIVAAVAMQANGGIPDDGV